MYPLGNGWVGGYWLWTALHVCHSGAEPPIGGGGEGGGAKGDRTEGEPVRKA